jgi:Glyoxalase/Bleomycin resistance protein/Dioxygenase superfamily
MPPGREHSATAAFQIVPGGWRPLGREHPPTQALHHHDGNDARLFDETVTGLDHVGFSMPARADLVIWQDHLQNNGVVRCAEANTPSTQSPIADEGYGSVLVFRDPDNIQLEFFSPPGRTRRQES